MERGRGDSSDKMKKFIIWYLIGFICLAFACFVAVHIMDSVRTMMDNPPVIYFKEIR
jgi:hypothetical protein